MDEQGRAAPLLTTERLILRGWSKDDFKPWHAIMSDRRVHLHVGGQPMSEEDTWRRLCASVGMWSMVGFGGLAVELKDGGQLIGNVGLFNAWRALEPAFGDEPEMGWIFAPEQHGKGLAGEACRAVLKWAEQTLQPTPVWAIIAPENAPSLRLAERLGFARVHETFYHDEPTVVLRRPDWS